MAEKDASGADRISQLPDGVREHVLSFLPAHEAVRTSVLARPWRDLWMGSPAFNITGWGTVAKFTMFVHRLLHLRHGSPSPRRQTTGNRWAQLDSCSFSFGTYDFDDANVAISGMLVNDWIQSALRCQVRVFRFCFDDSYVGRLLVDAKVLASEHLTRLQLAGAFFKDSLDLSVCSALLHLEIDDSYIASEEICSASLQHLSITLSDFHHMDRTRIRTPNLISCKLTDCCGKTPMLERMPSLATAVVELDMLHTYDKCSARNVHGCCSETCKGCRYYYGPHNDHTSCLILNGLSDATNLELSADAYTKGYKMLPHIQQSKDIDANRLVCS